MTIKKCDRCSKNYKPYEHANGTIKLDVYDSNHTSWNGSDHFDYCQKCTIVIEKFLRGKNA